MSAAVYRMFDADDRLLYVGQTTNIGQRLLTHQSVASWFTAVRSIDVIHVGSRNEATALERELIASGRPLLNVQHADRRSMGRSVGRRLGRPAGIPINAEGVRAALCGRTQSWLATEARISPSHLSSLMNGTRGGATLNVAQRIADALGVPVESVFSIGTESEARTAA